MAQDPNNLLVKYNIDVPGAAEGVTVEYRDGNKTALIFPGVNRLDVMTEAARGLWAALPERLKDSVKCGRTGDEFTVSMPDGTYQQLTGQKSNRGMAKEA